MLDINLFRAEKGGNPEIIRESQRRRQGDAGASLVDEIINLDTQWRQCQHKVEQELRKEMNKITNKVKQKKIKPETVAEEQEELIRQMKELKVLEAETNKEAKELHKTLMEKLRQVGNLVHDSVPISDDEANNEVIRTWGAPRKESGLKNHVDLVEMLGLANLKKGTEVAGGRGYYLMGAGVLLNQALISFGLSFLHERNYTVVQPPFFMTKEVMAECAQLVQYDEELYKVSGEGDDKYLIATSEQPLCALHRGDWIHPSELPIRYAGYSTCFRKEAGAHGRDTLGIFRVHQFEKVEQFCVTSPLANASWEMHEEMLKNSEEFYQKLGLPYRVVSIVSGALNDAAAKKYDLEAWFPASATYRELVSCSNCTDYQARNLEIRYGQTTSNEAAKQYVHLLNSTLTATERTICCILENYQTEGGVNVPEALQPFMYGIKFIPFQSQEAAVKVPKGSKSKPQNSGTVKGSDGNGSTNGQ
ncbi:hypothetical protein KP509_02G103200 [Ceratopteris richardii]|uniref:serine--tRNA ligase n=2 Tax=Ceratopteris richardii TaxID=49495 RepID=A0A8T2VKQ4_CERRI|nr:hypothetical protein KP509_02G103200 [Ceratopteris richardii]